MLWKVALISAFFLWEQNISSWVLKVCLAYIPRAYLCLPTLQAAASGRDAQDVWLLCQGVSCALIYPAQLSANNCGQGSWRALRAHKPGSLDSWCTWHQSDLWHGNLSAGHSSVGRHQGRLNYPDRSVFLMVALIMLQDMENGGRGWDDFSRCTKCSFAVIRGTLAAAME